MTTYKQGSLLMKFKRKDFTKQPNQFDSALSDIFLLFSVAKIIVLFRKYCQKILYKFYKEYLLHFVYHQKSTIKTVRNLLPLSMLIFT